MESAATSEGKDFLESSGGGGSKHLPSQSYWLGEILTLGAGFQVSIVEKLFQLRTASIASYILGLMRTLHR